MHQHKQIKQVQVVLPLPVVLVLWEQAVKVAKANPAAANTKAPAKVNPVKVQ